MSKRRRRAHEHPVSFKAQTYIWGYSLKLPTHESDNESIKIDDVQDQSDQNQDLSPLQAQREWISQAEENVLDRLVQAGLLAPPSDFDKILEQVTNNIVIGNNIQLTDAIRCRVLLTAPLESLAVGNTIILSKGLIDVLPSEADLAAVLSFQLAHIVLGHHIDTRYAFNDRLLFPDEATFERIHMSHSDADNELAAKKAIDLLNHSVYANQLSQPGLFLSATGCTLETAYGAEYAQAGRFVASSHRGALAERLDAQSAEARYEQAGSNRSPSSGQPIEDRCLGRQGDSLEHPVGAHHERAGQDAL